MRESRAWRVTRWVLLALFAIYFFGPQVAMLDFSTRNLEGSGRTGAAWSNLVHDPDVRSSIVTTLLLSVLTVALMLVLLVPTMIWVRLRVPKAMGLIAFLCLLPLTIPALVIVVGISAVYSWVTYFLGDSALTLTLAYAVLILPYAYRSIDSSLSSINVVTLSEAARSLGAGWFTVMARIVVPNIWSGIMSAAFVGVALVLGEYTFASLLHFNTLPVTIALLGKSDAQTSVAASLATLMLAFVLLLLLSLVGRRSRGSKGTSS